jgi:mono/diheme cytochrome c family protein
VPVWLIVVMFLLFFGGGVYFDQHGGWFDPQVYGPYQSFADLERYQPRREGPDLARGKAVFEAVCGLCHGVDGNGKPGQAPPLAGSEWATGNPDRMMRIPLYGLSGPITVKGQEWNLAMPAMGAALSSEDLSAVLTYIRSSWGNQASAISAEQLQAIKTKVGSRSQPFSASELSAIQ